ncbi:hypothetical protein AeMF1_015481 [Aphanomyces euteiches]|nr:hypothetical protein AeMF1_015481 [Aphanomyces euteiches]
MPNSIKCIQHRKEGICRSQPCYNQVYQHGVCVRHGGRRATCSETGCVHKSRVNGLRHAHSKHRPATKCEHSTCRSKARTGLYCLRHRGRTSGQLTSVVDENTSNQATNALQFTPAESALSLDAGLDEIDNRVIQMDDVLSYLSDRTAGIDHGCLGFSMFQDETVWSFNGVPEMCGFEESSLTESSVFDSDELTALLDNATLGGIFD